ncbi:hypothetical protein N7510_004967 [Penicillium lagena]|uniref:uncharacterized protein n=1 Tax=Penicillium lagena TaxID=94218 RepID=UPI002541645B|nr:uncharacterized protein N7510_004967 [Penicillium lagena]KAJ5620983.1 hypothetical protein N7510_004967 [Penicillium lagena]
MPPRLRGVLAKSLSRPLDSVFYCPSCAAWRRLSTRAGVNNHARGEKSNPAHRPLNPAAIPAPRPLSTSTVIGVGKVVPPRFKELYGALEAVRDAAIEQVSLSRLQLALRGLESETPLIRVAVLGLDNAASARRLVRLLLADPLRPRESWEDILETNDADTSPGLLIRYGPSVFFFTIGHFADGSVILDSYGEVSESISNDLLPTIAIPSPILKQGNLEILVSTLGSETDFAGTTLTADTFLVPTVTIQTSHSGRHNVVRYPVHRSIVCGSGVDGLLAYSSLVAQSDLKNEVASVRGAIELPLADKNPSRDRLSLVDIHRASKALDKFRESVQNVSEYERGWNGSGVQTVIDWLASSKVQKDGALNPALVPLIESLLDSADEGVLARDEKAIKHQTAGVVSDTVRANLERGIAVWAERAHSELRSSLEAGFASPRWRGLAWWKLFWRVDDVSMITSEILEKRFLRRSEHEVIWTAGKYHQAGLLAEHPPISLSESAPSNNSISSPWPTQIPDTRAKLLTTTVPSLQALAQSLVLFSVSTTTLTSTLSALTYVSIPSASIYESCTLAAVGLIYSLRRQQKKWDVARGFWEDEVREERTVIST